MGRDSPTGEKYHAKPGAVSAYRLRRGKGGLGQSKLPKGRRRGGR